MANGDFGGTLDVSTFLSSFLAFFTAFFSFFACFRSPFVILDIRCRPRRNAGITDIAPNVGPTPQESEFGSPCLPPATDTLVKGDEPYRQQQQLRDASAV